MTELRIRGRGVEPEAVSAWLETRSARHMDFVLHVVSAQRGHLVASSYNLFDAMMRLRCVLDTFGDILCCKGARVDAWASRALRTAGTARVYITRLGEVAASSPPVDALLPAECLLCGSVPQQLEFHRNWVNSVYGDVSVMEPSEVPAEVRYEAKLHPGGFVYKVEGEFGPDDRVPPESIVGAWKVDESGQVVGEFIPNPYFKPRR